MKRILIILYILLILPFCLTAQIGVNTELPKGTLGIRSASSAIPVVVSRNSDNTELAKLLDSGYLGLGGANPVVKLDLRGTEADGELGLGTTSMTAAAARAGAIRYNSGIEYSDGEVWVKLTALPTKAYVIAKNTSSFIPLASASSTWKNWTKDVDITNSFNASTGVFTVPRTGVYSISCTGMFHIVATMVGALRLEINLQVSSSTAANVKSAVAAPVGATGDLVNMTCVNKSFLYLQAGDTFYFYIWHNTTPSIEMTTDGSYNTLTISEM